MEQIWHWALSIAASSVGAAALLAVAAVLGRNQLSHWLNKDLERVKAGHQRELEAYKVTLIADTERAKALQDLQKSSALRILEKKFAAIDSLHRACSGLAVDVLTMRNSPLTQSSFDRQNAIQQRVNELGNAYHAVSVFFSLSEKKVSVDYRSAVIHTLAVLSVGSPDISDAEYEALQETLINAEVAIDNIVRSYVEHMQKV